MQRNIDNILTLIAEGSMVWLSVMVYNNICAVAPLPKECAEIVVMGIYCLCKTTSMKFFFAGSRKDVKATPPGDVGGASVIVGMTKANEKDLAQQRMELFHNEYKQEELQYRQQKKQAEDEKLQAVLQYTRDTFKRLEFEEAEVYQICESVRYFVTNRQVLSQTDVRIKRKANVTQINLKNFSWNIAFQYNIGGDITAQFVMQTFNEWFANCTLDTIRKNLRTTTGRRKIEICEKLPWAHFDEG